jgi:hypothetical protein
MCDGYATMLEMAIQNIDGEVDGKAATALRLGWYCDDDPGLGAPVAFTALRRGAPNPGLEDGIPLGYL